MAVDRQAGSEHFKLLISMKIVSILISRVPWEGRLKSQKDALEQPADCDGQRGQMLLPTFSSGVPIGRTWRTPAVGALPAPRTKKPLAEVRLRDAI